MSTTYETAIVALQRAPFDAFVRERKRLSDELLKGGDKPNATRLAKLARPPISAWAVNQLWWNERKAFDTLFKTAERLRDPNADAKETAAHRDAITKLRAAAAKVLEGTGKAATEATLRRITTTLSALAATGSFAPDAPGALARDRDPPGFEVAGLVASGAKRSSKKAPEQKRREPAESFSEKRRREREKERADAQKKAELERIERKLRIAQGAFESRKEAIARLKEELRDAETGLEEARSVIRELEKELRRSRDERPR